MPRELRIKPGEWSGRGGSDVTGNVSAKGIRWWKKDLDGENSP